MTRRANIQHGQARPVLRAWPWAAAGVLLATLVAAPVVHVLFGAIR